MKMSALTQPIQAACTEEKSVSEGRVSLIRNELATLYPIKMKIGY